MNELRSQIKSIAGKCFGDTFVNCFLFPAWSIRKSYIAATFDVANIRLNSTSSHFLLLTLYKEVMLS